MSEPAGPEGTDPQDTDQPEPVRRSSVDDEPVLPEQTSDDVDSDWRDRADARDDDERYLRERPPHWE